VDLYFHSLNTPPWRGAQLKKKHRDNFTLYLPRSRVPLENLTVTQIINKFPAIYGTRSFVHVHRILPLVTILGHMNSVYIFSPYSFKINFNIFLPSKSRSLKWSLPFRFSGQNLVWTSHSFHACYMPRSSRSP
jgi:hypothetical protein